MAQNKKNGGGLINRLMLGKEKSEGYARSTLPSNRWELFWDILKGRLGKLVIINLLMLIFFIPLAALILFRYIGIANYGTMYPFNQCFGVGYQAIPDMIGYSENIVFNVNMLIYLLLPIVAIIASLGLAGGCYVIRNMVWTEGIFVANDFWRGIKLNFKPIVLITLIYSLIFYVTMISSSFANYTAVVGAVPRWLGITMQVTSYSILFFATMVAFHMMTMCVTYEMKFRTLIKNGIVMTVGLLPQNIFFIICGGVSALFFMFGGILMGIGIILVLLIGFSFFLLVWTNFCQWAYDRFINSKIPGAQKNRGMYEKVKESDSGALKKYREQMAIASRSSLNSKPIKPITDDDLKLAELPSSFNRGDIEKLNESRRILYEDHAKYVEEHKNDPEFQQTEEEKKLEELKDERAKRIEKAKKELAKRNKNK